LYALLGNHDRHGDWEAEVAFSKLNDKWVLPDRYHFQRLSKSGISVCAWFLDTDKMLFDETQKSWLQSSLDSEAPTCKWKVVSGHHFVFSGGEYEDNHWLLKHLLPILDTHKVHLYLAGHEHQSQAIKMSSHPTWFLIAGALGDLRDKPNRGHEGLLFINKADVAFLRLIFSENHIDFSFVKTYTPGPGTVLYSGSVPL
jgi:acid phosphatase